jgi:hypothetical protein
VSAAAPSRQRGRSRRSARGPGAHRLYEPEPVAVSTGPGPGGEPLSVAGAAVESIREQWVVEDRWWEPRPLRRAYFELALTDGRVAVVFRCAERGRWFRQRA